MATTPQKLRNCCASRRLEGNSGSNQPTDLYLYKCDPQPSKKPEDAGKPNCHLWDLKILANGRAQILVRWPEPGQWKVIIDPLGGSPEREFALSEVITEVPGSRGVGPTACTPVNLVDTINRAWER